MGIGECILMAVLIIVLVLHGKEEKDRKDHLFWVEEERDRLRRVAYGYEQLCQEYTDRYISKHNDIICRYSKYGIPKYLIDNLYDMNSKFRDAIEKEKIDYSENLEKKYSSLIGHFRSNAYPDYMIDEYVNHVNNIAGKYRYIADLARSQIFEMNSTDK